MTYLSQIDDVGLVGDKCVVKLKKILNMNIRVEI